jgi:phosphocarrier protein HPr
MKYEARIELIRESQRVDAKSIFSLLTLAATPGTVLTLEAQGNDAEAAADAIAELVESGFGGEESAPASSASNRDRLSPEQA